MKPPRPGRNPALALALALVAGCAGAPTAGPTGPKATPGAKATASPAAARPTTTPRPAAGAPRVVDAGVPVRLTGQVRVLSDYGIGVVSNNGGGVVSNGGARVVSNNGGGLISVNGGGMIGKTKFFQVLQAQAAPPEDLVADAVVTVYDAAGRQLVDKAGKPITATSDKAGAYTLEATLPAENLVLRVALADGGELHGGELSALLPAREAAAAPLAVPLDTASSLGAAYVLDRFVKGSQAVLDRLPRAEHEALSAGMAAARAKLPLTRPVYTAEALALAAEGLRKQDAPLDATLERIEAILLAGQANLGEGLDATKVPLSTPIALAADAAGALYVAEAVPGRMRKIAPGGAISLFAGAALEPGRRDKPDAFKALFATITDMVAVPGGGFLVAEGDAHQVRRIGPDGRVTVVAGTGALGKGAPGGRAAETAITKPGAVAIAPDGTVLIGENQHQGGSGRLLKVSPDGTIGQVDLPDGLPAGVQFTGLCHGPDGTLYAATGIARIVLALKPGGPWVRLAEDLDLHDGSHVVPAPGGGVYLSETRGNRVWHVADDGTKRVIAGSGAAGYAGDGGPPAQARLRRPQGLLVLGDGRLAVVDGGNMVVRAFKPDDPTAPIATIAGTAGTVQVGPATAIAVALPGGLAVDPQDRLAIAEAGSSTVKRLDGGALTVLAGSTPGWKDGPALEAALNTPGGMAYGPDGTLWVLDTVQPRLRRLGPDGMVTTAVGKGTTGAYAADLAARRVAPAELELGRPLFVAVGPDGRPYWTDNARNVVFRLAADGQAEVLAGRLPATPDKGGGHQDGPAAEAAFDRPAGLAFDAAGDLYVADMGNMCVRKIAGLAAGAPVVSTVAGRPADTLPKLLSGDPAPPTAGPAAETYFFAPLTLAFDDAGRLYVGELGTARLDTLAGLPIFSELPTLMPSRIRRIDLAAPGAPVTPIAGPGGRVLAEAYGDGSLGLPLGLAVDRQGRLIVADGTNNQIKLIPKAAL